MWLERWLRVYLPFDHENLILILCTQGKSKVLAI